MTNPGATALRYHNATKHSPQSVAEGTHRLDWANQPLPFKVYSTLEPIRLPTEILPSRLPALHAISGVDVEPDRSAIPDLAQLARLCILSNGVTRVRRYSGGELAFRAAGTTGALYHVELYVACADLADLPAGLYHFGAHDNALRLLRAGDHRAALVAASGGEEALTRAPVIVIATSTFWRNAWKYQSRAWRHTFWDTGTVLANLLALAAASGLPARVVLGFADAQVNALLDVDREREAAVCLVAIGRDAQPPPPAPSAPPLNLETVRLSPREVRYPLIEEAQAATSLATPEDAAAWRARVAQEPPLPPPGEPGGSRAYRWDRYSGAKRAAPTSDDHSGWSSVARTGRSVDLYRSGWSSGVVGPADRRPPQGAAVEPIEVVIRRRGSSRRFARQRIPREALTTLVVAATAPLVADFVPSGGPLSDLYLIVNAVDDLAPGAYRWVADGGGLELVRAGEFRSEAGFLALGQELAADASVNLYWLADLEELLGELGGRSYRAAQLDAAVRAGRAWLAAYAIGLGATGLTFFDDEVTRFLGQDPSRIGVMFLLVAGPAATPPAAGS